MRRDRQADHLRSVEPDRVRHARLALGRRRQAPRAPGGFRRASLSSRDPRASGLRPRGSDGRPVDCRVGAASARREGDGDRSTGVRCPRDRSIGGIGHAVTRATGQLGADVEGRTGSRWRSSVRAARTRSLHARRERHHGGGPEGDGGVLRGIARNAVSRTGRCRVRPRRGAGLKEGRLRFMGRAARSRFEIRISGGRRGACSSRTSSTYPCRRSSSACRRRRSRACFPGSGGCAS